MERSLGVRLRLQKAKRAQPIGPLNGHGSGDSAGLAERMPNIKLGQACHGSDVGRKARSEAVAAKLPVAESGHAGQVGNSARKSIILDIELLDVDQKIKAGRQGTTHAAVVDLKLSEGNHGFDTSCQSTPEIGISSQEKFSKSGETVDGSREVAVQPVVGKSQGLDTVRQPSKRARGVDVANLARFLISNAENPEPLTASKSAIAWVRCVVVAGQGHIPTIINGPTTRSQRGVDFVQGRP